MNKSAKRIGKGVVVIAVVGYFLPKLVLFYLVCGLYDVSRNANLNAELFEKYFFGNGVLTWLLSPVNILLDILSLPNINKGVYRLEDLPRPYQAEIRHLIDSAHRQNLVAQIESVAQDQKRSMFFFKWYGADVSTVVDIPAFHESYKYVKTIGLSVFNKRQSTSRHFGPLRATLRVLYNINDMQDDGAYIVVGDVTNYWRSSKLFIFDDTLLHQSFNETDAVRYCLFVDILRPTQLPAVFALAVSAINRILSTGGNALLYGNWKVFKK